MDEINKLVSFLVVVRNEADHIGACIDSILRQTYPTIEVILVDGQSSDNTKEHAIEAFAKRNFSKYKIIDNPRKILASGWNLGIQNASGTYVVRIDAHAVIPKSFIEICVRRFCEIRRTESSVAAVGGRLALHCKGGSFVGRAILNLYNSPFGVGTASYRFGNRQQLADTVVYGLYLKSVFEKVGNFNENLKRNQDIEFHGRLKAKGYRLFFIPDVESTYFIRENIGALVKKAFTDGFWCSRVIKYLSSRHLAPFFFLIYLILLIPFKLIFSEFILSVLLMPMALYFLLDLYYTFRSILQLKSAALLSFLLFPTLHLSYGCGTLLGLLSKPKQKRI